MKKTINVLFAFIFAISCLFTSCANLVDNFTPENGDNGGNPTYSISGTVTGLGFEGQEYQKKSRTAMSDLSDIEETDIEYTVTAQKGDLVVTKKGSPFTLALPSAGEWTVSATGVEIINQSTVLSTDSKVIFISPVSPTGYVNLEARPLVTETGRGKIDLSFGTLPVKVHSVEIDCSDDNWQALLSDNNLVVDTSGIKTSGDAKIKSGSYTVDINFYDSSDVLCYNCTQTINVFNGFTTNTWIKHGSESYLVYKTVGSQKPGSAADFKLTDALLDQYVLKTIYVDPGYTGVSSTGTWLAPFTTLAEAVDKCTDDTKNYTINIMGDVEVNSGISVSKNITIQKASGASSAKIQYTSTSNCLFKVSESNTLEISNIDIEGPDVLSRQAGGAAIYNEGTLILNNVNLSKFKNGSSSDKGGCLYNTGNGTISITGGSITSCASNQGGAIYNAGKDLEIKDCTIDSCTAGLGGAIYNYCTAKITLSGTTSITRCTASNNGGGIYLSSNASNGAKAFLQDKASITSCTATRGGGIYASAAMCRIYMKDSAYLDSASDIRLNANGYVSLNGDLTPPAAANGIAATLTPQFYNVDDSGYPCTYSLLNEGDNTGLIARNYSKFKVTSQASDPAVGWCITSKGKLTVKISACSAKPSGITEFYITDIYDLNKIMDTAWIVAAGETYTLTDNLTANASTENKTFAAVFDGAGYTISGLKKSFVTQLSGTIKNLTLEGTSPTAGFATSVTSAGKIEKCTNRVEVTYSGSEAVDLGGFTQTNAGTITGCINDAEITYSGSGNIYDVGGIAGRSSGTITNCVNTGSLEGNTGISMTTSMAGGIVGDGSNRNSIIRNCKNTGKITNFTCAGGIAGATKGNIENCYNRASTISVISSTDYASGICGGVDDDGYNPAIKNCYSTTLITSTAAILASSDGSIEYCYYAYYDGAVAQAGQSDNDKTDSFANTGTSCTLSTKIVNIIDYGQSSDVLTLLKNWAASDSTKYSSWKTGNDGYPMFDWE